MAAYIPQHAARDANRYPTHLLREPRKLSVSAVTAATAYTPTIPSDNADTQSQHSYKSQRMASKTLRKGKSVEILSSYAPKDDDSDFSSVKSSSSRIDLDHPLLRKVGILPRGSASSLTILPVAPEVADDSASDYEHFLQTYQVTAIAHKSEIKVVNIERPGRLETISSNDISSSQLKPHRNTGSTPESSSRRSSATGSLISKVADYIKPSRPDSQYSQTSVGSSGGDSAQGSRRGSVLSTISRFSHTSKRRSSAKEIDAAAIEKAVIESYKKQPRTAPASPTHRYHPAAVRA